MNEAKIESGGKQEHNLIRTEELIIRPFCRVDNKLAKVKKKSVHAENAKTLKGLLLPKAWYEQQMTNAGKRFVGGGTELRE